MNISAYNIKVFTAVLAAGNITSAATKLGLTQPAVTRAIQKIEHELDVRLLIRTRKGVAATRAGQLLLRHSQDILEKFASLKEQLKNQTKELNGSFTIGVHSDLAGHTLPKFVNKLLYKHSKLELNFVHDLSREITRQVISLKLDFGIVVNPIQHLDLTITKLYSDRVGFFTSYQNKVQKIIKSEYVPILCNPDLTQTGKLLTRVKRLKLFPNARLTYTTNLQLIADLIAAGGGVGIIPETIAMLHYSDSLQMIAGIPAMQDEICLVYRKDNLRGTAASIIKNCILDSVKSAQ